MTTSLVGGHKPALCTTASHISAGKEMESFDEVLDRGVWCLYDQRLKSACGIANRRRNEPRRIASILSDCIRSQELLDAKEGRSGIDEDVHPDMSGKLINCHPRTSRDVELSSSTAPSRIPGNFPTTLCNNKGVATGRLPDRLFSSPYHVCCTVYVHPR
jgi:hypothetical protein